MHARLICRAVAVLLGASALMLSVPSRAIAVCGDNKIDGAEKCDGVDLGGRTCADVTSGFAQGGVVRCKGDCTLDVSDCRRAFIESLLPASAGPGKNRCQLEFGTVGTTTDPKVRVKRSCSDGDPGCDQDHQFNNSCTIRIQVCMNVPDARVAGCTSAKIIRLDVLKPSLNSTEANKLIASGVIAAAKNAAFDQGHISEAGVSYAPPITEFSCGSSTVKIPLVGTTGHARPGKVRIRARTTDNSGKTRSIGNLVLVCAP